MNALYFVFGIPLLGGLVLALVGHRSYARDLNVAFSTGSFIAACFLSIQVIDHGPMFAMDKQFLIDPLNVFLVSANGVVSIYQYRKIRIVGNLFTCIVQAKDAFDVFKL